MDDDWLTIKQASQLLDLSIQTIRRYIQNGKLKAELVKTSVGETWFINPEDIENIKQQRVVVQVPAPTGADMQKFLEKYKQQIIDEVAATVTSNLEKRDKELLEGINAIRVRMDQEKQIYLQQQSKKHWWQKLLEK